MMQRNRQFDDTEASAEVPAGLGYRIDEILAQLVGNLLQPVRFKLPQVFGGADLIKKRSLGWFVQGLSPCRLTTLSRQRPRGR
jgi:hypothetical protein